MVKVGCFSIAEPLLGVSMFHVPCRARILQPRRFRPLNGPTRHPQDSQEYSQLKLGSAVYGNLRDFLMKLTRSPTITR